MKGKRRRSGEAERMIAELFNRLTREEADALVARDDPIWLDVSVAVTAWHAIHWTRFGKPRLLTTDLAAYQHSLQTLTAIAQWAYALGRRNAD